LRTLFLTFLISLLLSAVNVFAGDVLVLQSLHVKPFDDALRGFRNVCKADTKTVVVSDAGVADMVRLVREERPRLIVAIGADALKSVKRIREIPVIYLMVLNPEKITGNARNFAGVDMSIPPEKYLSLMEGLHLPNMRVGILYDPEQSGDFLKKIQQTARAKGIEITAREVHKAKDVPEALSGMKGSFNLFWMLPDSTVVTPESFEFLLLFTQQNRTPVVTFASKYVDTGALASLDIDGLDLGKQAGEMANRVLDGERVSDIPRTEARKAVMKVNRKVATKLGINLAGIENY
jgi:putative tryptophan/tyrosine transport system substrate-binding protein